MSVVCLSTNGYNQYAGNGQPQKLFIATTEGLAIGEFANGSWHSEVVLEGHHVGALVYVPEENALFAGLMPGGLKYSGDLGKTWEDRSSGINEQKVYSLRVNREAEGLVLYAGVEPVSLYRSTDMGRSWTELSAIKSAPMHEKWQFPAPGHDPHLKTMTFDPRDPQVIYAGVEQGALLKSTDGGQSWQDLDSFVDYENFIYKDIHQVVLHPENPDEIYMPTGLGLFHSVDGGANWEHLTDHVTFRIGYPDQLIFAPDSPKTMFMSGAQDAPFNWVKRGSANGTVVISEDGGRNWRAPKGGFPEGRANVEAMAIYRTEAGFQLFAGTTDGEVFTSSDRGESWERIIEGISAVSKPTHDTLISGVSYGTEPPPPM